VITAPRITPIVALSKASPSDSSIGVPVSIEPGPFGFFAPNAVPRYAAEYGPGDAIRRYVPGGSSRNSNAPCASVVAVFGRKLKDDEVVVDETCVPFRVVVTRVVVTGSPCGAAVVPVVDPAGRSGMINDRFTVARRMGVPVSAATTRPRMIPVPLVSGGGRRPGSRAGPWYTGGGGGGGGTCGPAPNPIATRSAVSTTLDSFRQV
jgi:hypothetical protein